jgi:ATP-dependent DNA ligase
MPGFGRAHRTRISPLTLDVAEAQRWLDDTHGALDGVVGKRTGGSYAAGKRAMVKVKRLRTADCVVGGFRYSKGTQRSGRCFSGSSTTKESSTTSASPRPSPTPIAPL